MQNTLTSLRVQRSARRLNAFGPSAIAGFRADLSARIGGFPAAMGWLADYETTIREGSGQCDSPRRVAGTADGA